MTARRGKHGKLDKVLATGRLACKEVSAELLGGIRGEKTEVATNHYAYFPLNECGIVALFDSEGSPLNSERYYRTKLFSERSYPDHPGQGFLVRF